MFRDFSDEAKQKLLKYVDEVTADGTWDRVKDWFGDAGLTIQSWLGQLSIQNYVNDVDTYHKKVLDKNNTTAKQIGRSFRTCRQWIPNTSASQEVRQPAGMTS